MQRLGTIFLLIGAGLFMGYVGYKLATNEELAMTLRLAFGAGTIGLLAFILRGMREVWGKKDKYEEIER